jgi:hypothetical protein
MRRERISKMAANFIEAEEAFGLKSIPLVRAAAPS